MLKSYTLQSVIPVHLGWKTDVNLSHLLLQVLLWDVSQAGAVIRYPVRVVLMPIHHRYPSEALLLSVSFNSDGSRLAVTSKDRHVRVLDPRTGKILQV